MEVIKAKPWYTFGPLKARVEELKTKERGFFNVWDGTSRPAPKWIVLVAEGGGATSTYKVLLKPAEEGGDGLICDFNRTEFANISDAVDYMQARMFKGKDNQPLHLRRSDDVQIHDPRARAFTEHSAPRQRRPSARDRMALAQAAMGGGAGGAGGAAAAGRGASSTMPAGMRMMSPPAAGGARGGGDTQTMRASSRTKASASPAASPAAAAAGPSDPNADIVLTIIRTRPGKIGMGLKDYPGAGEGMMITKVDVDTDAGDTVGLKAGMRIKMVNAYNTVEQRGECRREFGKAKTVRLVVNDLGEAGLRELAPMSAETAAIFIAPMDSAGYDKLDIRHTEPCEIAPFARGKLMNRYFDILPNPATQVGLQMEGVDPASTYINANFVRSFGGRRATEYIASQGPLPATVEAFMRMIWEQKMVVLVQTTGFVEKGTNKCERYFPEDVGRLNVGPSGQWTVDCKRVDRRAGYNFSELIIHNNKTREQREVVHFWFNTWPDHGVPTKKGTSKIYADTTIDMLKEVRKTRIKMDQNAAPLLVHCSAGVGRTGTFIVIDQVITALEQGNNKIDIVDLIRTIREDRMALVQHTIQYKFAYQACLLFASRFSKAKGSEVFAGEAKRGGGGVSRARRESMKPNGAYVRKMVNGQEMFALRNPGNFEVEREESDKSNMRMTSFEEAPEQTDAELAKQEARVKARGLERQPWFRSGFTKAQVLELLGTHPKGYFCVTESSNAGCYTLSMKTMRKGQDITKLLLIPVEQPNGETHYKTGKHGDKSFPSVVDLVEYHIKHSGIKAHARGQSFKKQIAQVDADDEEC